MNTVKDSLGCLAILLGLWLGFAVIAFGFKYGWNLANKYNAPEVKVIEYHYETELSGD